MAKHKKAKKLAKKKKHKRQCKELKKSAQRHRYDIDHDDDDAENI